MGNKADLLNSFQGFIFFSNNFSQSVTPPRFYLLKILFRVRLPLLFQSLDSSPRISCENFLDLTDKSFCRYLFQLLLLLVRLYFAPFIYNTMILINHSSAVFSFCSVFFSARSGVGVAWCHFFFFLVDEPAFCSRLVCSCFRFFSWRMSQFSFWRFDGCPWKMTSG